MQPQPPPAPLRIQTPCPKKWEELTGSGGKRFCDACSLHVHDATQLREAEARALAANAVERVCMRLEYDASGAPVFLDTRARRPSWSTRVARWTLSAAAGLLAACHGSVSSTPAHSPADPNASPSPGKLGEVSTTVMGDVAAPVPPPEMGKVAAPQQVMGEATVAPPPPEQREQR